MNYEEKRELRLQISQLLADAGLNQATIKEMVENEIRNKVDRSITQTLAKLDKESSGGDYIRDRITDYLKHDYNARAYIATAIKKELQNRIIKVGFVKDSVELDGDDDYGL